MFGLRGLYNFGWQEEDREGGEKLKEGGRRVDEEEMMEGGLRGRFSAGGEVYFSARQRSFGSELLRHAAVHHLKLPIVLLNDHLERR